MKNQTVFDSISELQIEESKWLLKAGTEKKVSDHEMVSKPHQLGAAIQRRTVKINDFHCTKSEETSEVNSVNSSS